MKNSLFWLACAAFFIAACKKNTPTPAINVSIKGTWELRATRYGNILPATYAAGNGHLLVFGNTSYTEYTSGSVVDSGYYTLSADTSYRYVAFSTATSSTFNTHISFKNDTLLFRPTQPDISTGFYVKTN